MSTTRILIFSILSLSAICSSNLDCILEKLSSPRCLINAVFSLNVWPGGSVRFVKTAMRLLGIPGSYPRPPFELLDAAQTRIVEASMRKLDLPEWRGRLG